MKSKRLGAILICFVFLFCSACTGESELAIALADKSTATATEQAKTTEAETTAGPVSVQELYDDFLSEQFRDYVGIDDPNDPGLRNPPHFNLAGQRYAFYDVDNNGQQELLWFVRSGDDSADLVYGVYTVRNSTVVEIPIHNYMFNGVPSHPVLMNNGVMRATIGSGHVPGYAYLRLINGAFEQTDLFMPPYKTSSYEQTGYEHTHYDDEVYTKGWKDNGVKKETVTAQEFEARIARLNGNAEPIKPDIKSLLDFGQARKYPIKWLGDPTDKTVSFTTPKAAPLPQTEGLRKKYEGKVKSESLYYRWQVEDAQKPNKPYDSKVPAKQYYAFYDLDGNGDAELFFGSLNKNGKIIISKWYNEEIECKMERFASAAPGDSYVLSNGRVVFEYLITEGKVPGRVLVYRGIEKNQSAENGRSFQKVALWSYGDEAAFYNYFKPSGRLPVSLTQEAYQRQRAELEKDSQVVRLDWKALENY